MIDGTPLHARRRAPEETHIPHADGLAASRARIRRAWKVPRARSRID
jgi:hypothetical protein